MARKKKTEEATAAIVDAAPVAEALETEQAAPVEVVEETPQAEQDIDVVSADDELVEYPGDMEAGEVAEVTEEKPADDGMTELLDTLDAMVAADRPVIAIPAEIRAASVRAERARLAEMWRMGGCGELDGIGAELRDVLRGIKARPDVHRPASLGEQVLTTAELIKVLEEAGGDWAPVLRRWYRANHRRAGTSIYVQLALAELDEEGVDEPGQEQDEGSADV